LALTFVEELLTMNEELVSLNDEAKVLQNVIFKNILKITGDA
jgi:hypothetical protein